MKVIKKLVSISLTMFVSMVAVAQNADPSMECFNALENVSELQPLKGKVALGNINSQTIEILANDNKPNKSEKSALLKWDELRKPCVKQSMEWSNSNFAPNIAILIDRLRSQFQANLADLYAGKITYGQFAKARQANVDDLKAQAANINQQNQNSYNQQQQRQQELNQQAQAQDDAQRRALAAQMIMNNKPYQAPMPQAASPYQMPQLQAPKAPTNTNCRMIGNTMNCTTY